MISHEQKVALYEDIKKAFKRDPKRFYRPEYELADLESFLRAVESLDETRYHLLVQSAFEVQISILRQELGELVK